MGRPIASFHALTILLTALLVWPWNVVLTVAESFQIATQVQLGTVHVQAKPRVQRVVRYGHWNPPSCSVIALDYDRDEEEGDDGNPFSPSSVFQSIASHPCGVTPDFSSTFTVLPVRIVEREHPCHLRC